MMHSSPMLESAPVQPRWRKTPLLALVGVSAVCACLFHSGAQQGELRALNTASERPIAT